MTEKSEKRTPRRPFFAHRDLPRTCVHTSWNRELACIDSCAFPTHTGKHGWLCRTHAVQLEERSRRYLDQGTPRVEFDARDISVREARIIANLAPNDPGWIRLCRDTELWAEIGSTTRLD